MQRLRKWIWIALGLLAFNLIAHWCAVQSWGTDSLLIVMQGVMFLMFFVSPIWGIVALFRAGLCETSNKHLLTVVGLAILWVALFVGEGIGHSIRARGLAAMVERSRPVVEAIEAYQARYGKSPERLNALVPEFLAAIPETGVRAYPEFWLFTDDRPDRPPWRLVINTCSGFLWSHLAYEPPGPWRDSRWRDTARHFGDWIYVVD